MSEILIRRVEKRVYSGVCSLSEGVKPLVDLREVARGRKRSCAARDTDPFSSLKRAANLAADALCAFVADENQLRVYTYTDKASGATAEVLLEARNLSRIRETIGALKDLTALVRSLNGLLSPEEQAAIDAQMAKIRVEEKKLEGGEERSETGVVLLPEAEADENA